MHYRQIAFRKVYRRASQSALDKGLGRQYTGISLEEMSRLGVE